MTTGNQVDKSTYESARKYLKAALEHMIAAGRSAREFGDFALEKFGDTFTPYLHEFSQDVSKGRIKVEGLSKSARRALFGPHITPEERERMIREAAYLRAERRGFSGGSADDDWRMAELEINQRLAQETGLVVQGHKVLTSATAIIENEFDDIKKVVAGWLESRSTPEEERVVEKKKKSAKKSPARTKKDLPEQQLDKPAEKRSRKTATVKKAVKKASSKKASQKEE